MLLFKTENKCHIEKKTLREKKNCLLSQKSQKSTADLSNNVSGDIGCKQTSILLARWRAEANFHMVRETHKISFEILS